MGEDKNRSRLKRATTVSRELPISDSNALEANLKPLVLVLYFLTKTFKANLAVYMTCGR